MFTRANKSHAVLFHVEELLAPCQIFRVKDHSLFAVRGIHCIPSYLPYLVTET
jgi:hypothetical protein